MYCLIMAGGGHAQLSVLKALAQKSLDIDAVLITPGPYQIYSGMLPGWIAGHYSLSDCQIDLRPLAKSAGIRLIFSQLVKVNAKQHRVVLSNGMHLDYDGLSLDVGSETDLSLLEAAGERLLPIKPLANFVRRWPTILNTASQQDHYQLVVVGGGAAGVELAFAAQHAFATQQFKQASVTLVASANGILPGHAKAVKHRARALLAQRGITLIQAQAVSTSEGITLSNGRSLTADCIIAATGARPPAWLRGSDLALDEKGYVLVDAHHRSTSHPNVLAAGDVCVRSDIQLVHSGVNAVFAGPVLAHNLIAALNGHALESYQPRKKSLYLLATGPKHAIASWGAFSAQGHWVWRWKNWIDRRFMHKYGPLNHGQKVMTA